MSNSKISIKCHFEGSWRRFAIQNSFYTELISTIKEIFTVESQNELVTYYVDSEGDEVRFSSDHELQQAINFFVKVESSYTLKMYVKMTEVKSNPVSTQQNLASSQHQVPSATHGGVRCDYCQQKPIQGVRFKCVICPDFDLCESCEKLHISIGDHLYYHPMLKMFRPMNLAGAYIRNENEETLVGFIPEQQQQQQQLSPNARSHVQVSPKTEVAEKLEESYQKISIGTETDFALTENVQTQTHETQSSISVLSSSPSSSNQIKKVLRSNSISSCGSDSLSYCSATFSERQEQKQQEFDEEQTQQDKSFSISNLSMESSYGSQNTNTQELSQNKDTRLSLMTQYINGFWRLQGTDLMIRVFEEENEFKLSLGQDVLDVKNLTENSFVIEWSSKAPSTFVRKESIPNALIEKDRRIWVRTSQPIISTPTTEPTTEPTTTTSPFSWRAKPGRFSARRETSNSQENRNSFDLSENGNMNNTSVFVEESKKQETFSVPTSPSLSGKGSIAQSYIELESEQPQFELIGEGTNLNSNSNEEDSNSGTTNSSSTSNTENDYSQIQEIQTKEKGQQSSQDLDSEWERINPNQEDESQQNNQQNEVEVVKVKFEPSPELSKIEGWEKLLDQLKEMGFDHDENFKIGLLIEHEGRLQEVVNRLISN